MRRALAIAVVLGMAVLVFLGTRQSMEVIELQNQAVDCRERDAKRGIFLATPTCTGERDVGAGPVQISFNAHGYRGPEWAAVPEPGITRVALLGGSNMLAPGLPDALEPGALVQQKLHEMGHDQVEVVNLSVEGHTTSHHAVRLGDTLRDLSPDVVVLLTISDDKVFRDIVLHSYLKFSESGQPIGFESGKESMGSFVFGLIGWSDTLKSYMRTALESFRFLRVAHELRDFDPTVAGPRPWSGVQVMTHRMALKVEKAGAKFIAVRLPMSNPSNRVLQLSDTPWVAKAFARFTPDTTFPSGGFLRGLEKRGHAVVDMVGKVPNPKLRREHFIGETHYLNETGIRWFTRALAQNLEPHLP
jgi:hypothetical protein